MLPAPIVISGRGELAKHNVAPIKLPNTTTGRLSLKAIFMASQPVRDHCLTFQLGSRLRCCLELRIGWGSGAIARWLTRNIKRMPALYIGLDGAESAGVRDRTTSCPFGCARPLAEGRISCKNASEPGPRFGLDRASGSRIQTAVRDRGRACHS
jgi:hypothetical protein